MRLEPCVLKVLATKKGNFRLVGYPDAAYGQNAENSSQRGHTIFLAEERTVSKDGVDSLIDF